MPVRSLRLQNFTVFQDATFELCPGINVLLGANGTGKSHVLKAAYCLAKPLSGQTDEKSQIKGTLQLLTWVFQLEGEGHSYTLLRRRGVAGTASAYCSLSLPEGRIAFGLLGDGVQTVARPTELPAMQQVIFLPPREVLSMYPGFTRLWEKYRLSFDSTYYDLCKALSGPLLRKIPEWVKQVTAPLERALGGKVVLKNDRFYVAKKDGDLAISLEAEGLRKLAMVLHLLHNGSLEPGSVLLWDEPEANMNPKLVGVMKELLLGLARAGIQIVLATHDYLLSSELSLVGKYGGDKDAVRFFCLFHESPEAPVRVESGATLADLAHNPIVEEFAAHYDREAALFAEPESVPEPARKPRAKSKVRTKTPLKAAARKRPS